MWHVEIHWSDLTEEKQKELIELVGYNKDWDNDPITIVEIQTDDSDYGTRGRGRNAAYVFADYDLPF